jgi:magnesium-transporting ATPase (P-type)
VTVICTDKTGTLTENRMRASRVVLGLEALDAAALAARPDLVAAHPLFFRVARWCQDLTETLDEGTAASTAIRWKSPSSR